jgi:hypothetical protein
VISFVTKLTLLREKKLTPLVNSVNAANDPLKADYSKISEANPSGFN